MTGQIITHQKK